MFTVVLATDGHKERVMAQVEAVADYPCASEEIEVLIVNVAKEIQSDEGGKINIEEYADMPESASNALSFFQSEGITARAEQRSGDPAEEIIRAARDADANQIILGGRKRSPVGKAVFGSVVQKVIFDAECPVLTTNIEVRRVS
ncbi:universal stress protein [Halalkalicoccus jeotgali]|uniref:UspA domain protein n=1 Tax=Halalkalicoccus jeotgali (strain DSM 18796 / CECT 7217 / JCM 14584 / KCTC 4019 / B3) TaxID=795797 RepID=D8JCW4_HALJB|nr:universal stress protein [Halalkalicoccus jeotgali]ADJ16859.1 UspA domain protein [Halalkalicoccus jeotgali B3]ELY38705.1 UspA domain protein [Halalkalicoccus jeotgali B3]